MQTEKRQGGRRAEACSEITGPTWPRVDSFHTSRPQSCASTGNTRAHTRVLHTWGPASTRFQARAARSCPRRDPLLHDMLFQAIDLLFWFPFALVLFRISVPFSLVGRRNVASTLRPAPGCVCAWVRGGKDGSGQALLPHALLLSPHAL